MIKGKRCFFAIAAAALCLAALYSCGQKGAPKAAAPGFPMVEAPAVITEPPARIDYMAEHFWDTFLSGAFGADSADSLAVRGVPAKDLESKFAMWASFVKGASYGSMQKAVITFGRKAAADSVAYPALLALADKFLYDPSSPTRNEEAYLFLLETILEGSLPDESSRPSYQLAKEKCSLNRIGEKAADFAFKDGAGKRRTLHGIKATVTLIFFGNPGCTACTQYKEAFEEDKAVAAKIAAGEICVVNAYPDEDTVLNDLYNIRAIPSLYLLDSDKTVMLKDASVQEVMEQLYAIFF